MNRCEQFARFDTGSPLAPRGGKFSHEELTRFALWAYAPRSRSSDRQIGIGVAQPSTRECIERIDNRLENIKGGARCRLALVDLPPVR